MVRQLAEVLEVFNEMGNGGIQPNAVTLSLALIGCVNNIGR